MLVASGMKMARAKLRSVRRGGGAGYIIGGIIGYMPGGGGGGICGITTGPRPGGGGGGGENAPCGSIGPCPGGGCGIMLVSNFENRKPKTESNNQIRMTKS